MRLAFIAVLLCTGSVVWANAQDKEPRPPDKIRLGDVLDIARRTHAEAVVLGNFAAFGDQIRANVQFHDASSGQPNFADQIVVNRHSKILTQIDLLSLKTQRMGSCSSGSGQEYRLGRGHDGQSRSPPLLLAWPEEYLEKAFILSGHLTEKRQALHGRLVCIARGDYPSSVRTFQQIIAQYPLEIEAYWRLARLLCGEERWEETVAILKRGLAVDPEAKDLSDGLGFVLLDLGRNEEALRAHKHYVELAPREPKRRPTSSPGT